MTISEMLTNNSRVIPIKSNAGDTKTITAYTHYLAMKGQTAGNFRFDGHSPTAEEILVAEQCRVLCDKISQLLAVSKESDIPDLLECYDIACRIGNKCMPDIVFINRHKHRVVKAWKSGDRKIEESSVFGIVAPEVSYHSERADRDYSTAYLSLKEKWIATLRTYDCFPDVTAYENYQRLALIMSENLEYELGADAAEVKRRWYEHNRVEDLSTLSSIILRSYRRFAASLYPIVVNDFDKKVELDNKIIEELASRTDIEPYDREAYRMAWRFNQKMMQ